MWSVWKKKFFGRERKREIEFRSKLIEAVKEAKKFDAANYTQVNRHFFYTIEVLLCGTSCQVQVAGTQPLFLGGFDCSYAIGFTDKRGGQNENIAPSLM